VIYICKKDQQNVHFFLINDFIQLYYLRHASNNNVFIFRVFEHIKYILSVTRLLI